MHTWTCCFFDQCERATHLVCCTGPIPFHFDWLMPQNLPGDQHGTWKSDGSPINCWQGSFWVTPSALPDKLLQEMLYYPSMTHFLAKQSFFARLGDFERLLSWREYVLFKHSSSTSPKPKPHMSSKHWRGWIKQAFTIMLLCGWQRKLHLTWL